MSASNFCLFQPHKEKDKEKDPMKFGLQVINTWDGMKGVEDGSHFLVDLAVTAEKAGWDGFFLWDHLLFPWDVPLIEPWIVLGAIASWTEKESFRKKHAC